MIAWARNLWSKFGGAGGEFVRETAAGILAESVTQGRKAVQERVEHMRRISSIRPRLESMIFTLKDDAARENLWRRYKDVCRKDKQEGTENEDRFVTLLARVLELPENQQEAVLTILGRMEDEEFLMALEFVENKPVWNAMLRFVTRNRNRIKAFAAEVDRQADEAAQILERWCDSLERWMARREQMRQERRR